MTWEKIWGKIEPLLVTLSVLFIVLVFGVVLLVDSDVERLLDSLIENFAYRPRVTVIGGDDIQATQNNPQTSALRQRTEAADGTDRALVALKPQVSELLSRVSQHQERVAVLETRRGQSKASESVEKWRAAWQAQNTAAYVAYYTDDFRPANGQSHEAWVKDRQVKLTRPKTISVHLDNLQVQQLDRQRWKATFRQRYQSDTYQDVVTKELTLVKVGNHYLIEKERVL